MWYSQKGKRWNDENAKTLSITRPFHTQLMLRDTICENNLILRRHRGVRFRETLSELVLRKRKEREHLPCVNEAIDTNDPRSSILLTHDNLRRESRTGPLDRITYGWSVDMFWNGVMFLPHVSEFLMEIIRDVDRWAQKRKGRAKTDATETNSQTMLS